jgi:hypothetical protein
MLSSGGDWTLGGDWTFLKPQDAKLRVFLEVQTHCFLLFKGFTFRCPKLIFGTFAQGTKIYPHVMWYLRDMQSNPLPSAETSTWLTVQDAVSYCQSTGLARTPKT